MMDLGGRHVVVVGLGKSGLAAIRLALTLGARVTATDSRPEGELAAAAREPGVRLIAGGHDGVPFDEADLVVVSPGVPPLPELDRAVERGVEVIGELELGWRCCRGPLVAVGGTNGKSTTTHAVACMLKAHGGRVFVGGNLGTPLSEAAGSAWDALVVEVSSFQLERAPTFRPRVGVLLNVSEDHLDRYPDFAAYARAKGNAFVNQGPDDVAVIPGADPVCREQALRGRGRIVTFGAAEDGSAALAAEGEHLAVDGRTVHETTTGERYDLSGTDFVGAHNAANAAAAIAAARALGVAPAAVRDGLARFRALDHRMCLAGVIDGVSYYDDSKATNVGAAVTALLGLAEERVVLVAGGRDKHGSYAPLRDALARKGRGLVVLGEAAERIAAVMGKSLPVERATSMEEAVVQASRLARPGDAVLLSPACSSFDMFGSYAERGDRFVAAVKRLQAEREA